MYNKNYYYKINSNIELWLFRQLSVCQRLGLICHVKSNPNPTVTLKTNPTVTPKLALRLTLIPKANL